MIRKLTQLLFILSFTLLFLSTPVLAANISGNVTYDSVPVCSMVLANGQYMFTCSGDGSFSLDVPLDANGEITVYAFCSGLAPYKQIITPDQGTGMQINMLAGEAGAGMDVDYTIKAMNTTWALVEGTMTYNSVPVCAMALANGQYQFTCSGDGSFSLLVPLDDMGSILLYGFCEGLPPHQTLFTTNEIDFNADYDNDGYTVANGDCNDFNAAINPGETEVCGDGVDQNCDGVDEICGSASDNTGMYAYPFNLTSIVYEEDQGSSSTATFSYNSGGDLARTGFSQSSNETVYWDYYYNASGNIDRAYNPNNGDSINFTYNGNLPIFATDQNGTEVYRFTYDVKGRLQESVENIDGAIYISTYFYDENDRVAKVENLNTTHEEYWSNSVVFFRDNSGNLLNVNVDIDQNGDTITDETVRMIYHYDGTGKMTSYVDVFDYVSTPGIVDYTTYYTLKYDGSNNIIQVLEKEDENTDGSIESSATTTFTYTSQGMLTEDLLASPTSPVRLPAFLTMLQMWWRSDGAFFR